MLQKNVQFEMDRKYLAVLFELCYVRHGRSLNLNPADDTPINENLPSLGPLLLVFLTVLGINQLMEQLPINNIGMFRRNGEPLCNRSPDRRADGYLCWSRMQAEAGQKLEDIIARKECERRAGDGLFLWGVGNAPPLVINELVCMDKKIPVVFSIMKSKAKAIDVAPERVVIWRRYFDSNGFQQPLPEHALVISRSDRETDAKKFHYALMCYSDTPLQLKYGTPFDHHAYRNASKRGGPIAPSQVTALLNLTSEPSKNPGYEVNLRAMLTANYWIRLTDPLELSHEKLTALNRCDDIPIREWNPFVSYLRHGWTNFMDRNEPQLVMF